MLPARSGRRSKRRWMEGVRSRLNEKDRLVQSLLVERTGGNLSRHRLQTKIVVRR